MTNYETRLREACWNRRSFHSEEAYQAVVSAIAKRSKMDDFRSSEMVEEAKRQVRDLIANDDDAYDWLKRNGVGDLTPAFCAGARHIGAVAAWFLGKDAVALFHEAKEAM